MNGKYIIRKHDDREYAVYLQTEHDIDLARVFIGSLEEVNAWISLKEKGFDF